MKEFKELSSYKNRGNSYIFISYIIKPIKRVYRKLSVFVPNSPPITAPYSYEDSYGHMFIPTTRAPYRRCYSDYKHEPKIPRNSLCPCNSGKKYKK